MPVEIIALGLYVLLRLERTQLMIGTGAVLLVALYLVACYVILSESLEPVRTLTGRTPIDSGFAAEEVRFENEEDRVPMAGWLLPSSGDRAIVLLHGLTCDHWSGSQPDMARAYVDAGFHVLVFDLRGHGRSGGKLLGLGWHDRHDVRAAVNLLLERGFRPGRIGIHGVSYGAATALLATAVIPEVGAVVADSAFADVRDLMDAEIEGRIGVPSAVTRFFFRPGIAFLARLHYSLDLDVIPPERAVADIAPRPILFIHGSEDRRIPVGHTRRLHAASKNANSDSWILPGFGHTEGVRLEGNGCETTEVSPMREAFLMRVTAFFDKALH